MKFERINKHSVRCIVEEEDLKQYQVDIDDFFTNSDKIHRFLHEMVHEAKKEVNYHPNKGVLSMQITMLSEKSLAINLSENDQSLETLREEIKSKIKKEMVEDSKNVVEVSPSYLRIYEFDTLNEVIHYSHTISSRCQVASSLFKQDEQYYLCVERGNASIENFARTCLRANDFGKFISDSQARKAYIEEQSECIFQKRAVNQLKKIDL